LENSQPTSARGTADPHTIIFLHIHKTAGTTLHTILDRQYQPQEVYVIDADGHNLDHFANLSQQRRDAVRLLKGHMDFGLHEFLRLPYTYFTFLRRPIERVISHYYFIRRTPSHPHYHLARRLNLRQFVESETNKLMVNGQTRILAGGYPHYRFGSKKNELLERAKRNLRQHFAVVGLMEQFDESLLLLKKTFGWRHILYMRQNVSVSRPRRDDLPPDTLALLRKVNEVDSALYEYGRSLFADQLAAQAPSFRTELRLFQTLNAGWHYLWQANQLRMHITRRLLTNWR